MHSPALLICPPATGTQILLATPVIRMILPFDSATQSPSYEALKVLPTDVLVTLSPVFTHDLVLVGVIGGVALGVVILWLLVVRTRKLKANVASDGTESAPLLNPNRTRADLQRDHTPTGTLDTDSGALFGFICANPDFYQNFRDGIAETRVPLGSLSSILSTQFATHNAMLSSGV